MTDSNKEIKAVLREVEETKKIMETNVEKLIARAELLDRLDVKSKDLRHQAQVFALNSNELKTTLQTKNYIYAGIILFGILGSMYGVVSGYSPVSCLMTGMFGSAAGGTLGYFSGAIKAKVGRLVFAYQLQDSPFNALKAKFSKGLKEKVIPDYTADLRKQANTDDDKKSLNHQNHHEQEIQPLEISRTLTQWFEAKKQEKTEKEGEIHKPSQKPKSSSLKAD